MEIIRRNVTGTFCLCREASHFAGNQVPALQLSAASVHAPIVRSASDYSREWPGTWWRALGKCLPGRWTRRGDRAGNVCRKWLVVVVVGRHSLFHD